MTESVYRSIIYFMSKTTTTTTAKLVNRKNRKLTPAPKKQKAYTRLELLAEFTRLSGETKDPAYLADLVSGARHNHRIGEFAKAAAANLIKASKAT